MEVEGGDGVVDDDGVGVGGGADFGEGCAGVEAGVGDAGAGGVWW